MSGGSWNYMYKLKYGINDQEWRLGQIPDMAKRLRELGFNEAARATEEAQDKLDELMHAIEELADIWQAVEWYDSRDWGIDQIKIAENQYINNKYAKLIQYISGQEDKQT